MPDHPFAVRPALPTEYGAVGTAIADAYRGLEYQPPNSEWYYDELRDVETRARRSCVLAAVAPDGDVLGGVTYVAGPEDPYSEELSAGDAGIRMLGVSPRHQRRGVGRALVEACIERAREAGRTRVVLHSGAWMTAAQRLYPRLGFRREPSLDFEPVPGVAIVAFVLPLDRHGRGA